VVYRFLTPASTGSSTCAPGRGDRPSAIAVFGCFANSGQLCISVERIYIEDAVYDDFVAAFRRVRR